MAHHGSQSHNRKIGSAGESIAAAWLEDRGFRVLDRNWRCAVGELDIVAAEQHALVFVEVKTRTGTSLGHPLEAVTASKLARLRVLAGEWCAAHPDQHRSAVRVDAVAVLLRPGLAPEVEHVRGCR